MYTVCTLNVKSENHKYIKHYNDAIMRAMASQITSLTIVYSTVFSGADQRKHQSTTLLVFVREIHRWLVTSPQKWPVTRKMFPFDYVIMSGMYGRGHIYGCILTPFLWGTILLFRTHINSHDMKHESWSMTAPKQNRTILYNKEIKNAIRNCVFLLCGWQTYCLEQRDRVMCFSPLYVLQLRHTAFWIT